jgi:hypothetical protein
MEEEFSEVELPLYGVLRSSAPKLATWYTGAAEARSGVVVGIIGIVVGVLLVVFRRPFARDAVSHQNDLLGFRFGERELRRTSYMAVLGGISSPNPPRSPSCSGS